MVTTITTVKVQRTCMWCNKTYFINLDKAKVARHAAGEHVQNVWPELDAGQREQIISGTHDACFDDMFKNDDED